VRLLNPFILPLELAAEGRIPEAGEYEDVPGLRKSATLDDVASRGLVKRAVCS
jgi:hypothetical protein